MFSFRQILFALAGGIFGAASLFGEVGRALYSTPGYMLGDYAPAAPASLRCVPTTRQLTFPGATLEELVGCEFAGVMCGSSMSTREDARAYHVKEYRNAAGRLEFLVVPIQKADDTKNNYVKCVVIKLTEETDGVWGQAVAARYYKSASAAAAATDQKTLDFVNVSASGTLSYNHSSMTAVDRYNASGYAVGAFCAMRWVQRSASLAFTNAASAAPLTLDDLKGLSFTARIAGLSCAPNKYELVEAQNKSVTFDATGHASKIRLEMQLLSDGYVKCPIVELTNGAGGVWARAVTSRYAPISSGAALGFPFVKADGSYSGVDGGACATHILMTGYGVAGLAAVEPPAPPPPPFEGPDRVTATLAPGFYTNTVAVGLVYADPEAEIHYTLDGSTPTAETNATCFVYTGALSFADICAAPNPLSSTIRTNPPEFDTKNTNYAWIAPKADPPNVHVLRARAFKGELTCTNEFAGTWLVGTVPNSHTLRVVSIIADHEDLFGDAKGLMVPGNIYKSSGFGSSSVGKPNANYFQSGDTWERLAHFELFETNHAPAASCTLGLRMHGGFSRAWAQKTLRCCLRAEYGQKNINYPLFSDDPYSKYKRFLLRNSGNDWCYTGFRDAVSQQIFRPFLRSDTQGYAPVVLYINGEYWGILNLRHHYSKHFFERKYGADPENVDFLKYDASGGLETAEGDQVAYNDLLSFLNAHPLSNAAAYREFLTRVDIDSLIDDYILHVFLAVTDWPHNNQGLWRERVAYTNDVPAPHDGRWRWMAYDTDSGSALPVINGSVSIDSLSSSYAKKNPLFKACCDNREFITNFVSRTADLLNTALLNARSQAIIDEAAATVAPEMPRHIARWTRQTSPAAWTNQVQIFRAFFSNRIPYLKQYLDNRFQTGSEHTLTVDVTGGGHVGVNSLSSAGKAPTALALPWRGTYFANYAVTLKALPQPGWEFVDWNLSGRTSTSPELSLFLTGDTHATAVFRKVPLPAVRINEVMAEAEGDDWFELYNADTKPVNLKGYWLADDSDKHLTEIAADLTLAPGAFLLVRTGDAFTPGPAGDGTLLMNFGLSKKGDAVRLFAPDKTTLIDAVLFGAQKKNVSEGRSPNGSGNWGRLVQPTPGAPNAPLRPHFSVFMR